MDRFFKVSSYDFITWTGSTKEQQGLDLHFKVVFAISPAGGCQWLTSIASNF